MWLKGGENQSLPILFTGYSAKAQCTGEPRLHAINRGGIGYREQIGENQAVNLYVDSANKELPKAYKFPDSIMKSHGTLTTHLQVQTENYKFAEESTMSETKTTQPTPTSQPEPTLQAPTAKRPLGIIILSILGSIGGAYLFYAGLTGLNADLEILTLLFQGQYATAPTAIKNWISWAVPVETATMLISFILGIMLLTTIFGLLNGRSWSYKYGMRLPLVSVILSWTALLLFFTAPVFVEAELLGTIIRAIISIIGASTFILYLRQPHVKNWLNVNARGQPKTQPKNAKEDE
jgi:hypothetical protein